MRSGRSRLRVFRGFMYACMCCGEDEAGELVVTIRPFTSGLYSLCVVLCRVVSCRSVYGHILVCPRTTRHDMTEPMLVRWFGYHGSPCLFEFWVRMFGRVEDLVVQLVGRIGCVGARGEGSSFYFYFCLVFVRARRVFLYLFAVLSLVVRFIIVSSY